MLFFSLQTKYGKLNRSESCESESVSTLKTEVKTCFDFFSFFVFSGTIYYK